ncbi:uncharacterized protein [Anabrus simplex]|uniref:uncharacterized protein n=1 Tax=Anabrus simplex TaxID=316456 RepID=UPI0035A298CD
MRGCLVAAHNSTTPELKPNERFRRLIPYMTFYFAQQNYGSKPQFQQYHGPATVYPVSNNKLPQYQGNLVVPATYLRPNRPATKPLPQQVYEPQSSIRQHNPQIFPSNDASSYNTLFNNDPYFADTPRPSYDATQGQIELPYPTLPTAPSPSILSVNTRTATLIRILSILQQTQRLPQTVTASNSGQTLSQILSILQQTNQLPIETRSSLLKFITQIPHYYKQPQAISITSTGSPISAKPQLTPKLPITIYTSKLPQAITTPLPGINILHNTAVPKLQSMVTESNIPEISRGYSDGISTTPTPSLTEQTNELQNYNIPVRLSEVKVIPNGEDSNRPASDDEDKLQPYEYANKDVDKVPSYYGGSTFTQSYPDPNSEGSTPGRAGIDYPTYSSIPQTSFNCKTQRYKGFFGDPETSCQVWHYCDLNGGQASFLCPNGTIFSQVGLTCDWWFNVRCASTEQLYVLNERLYKYILPVMPSFPEDFSGPLVDQYLTRKFQEQENKKKNKTTTTTTTEAPSEQTQR